MTTDTSAIRRLTVEEAASLWIDAERRLLRKRESVVDAKQAECEAAQDAAFAREQYRLAVERRSGL